MFKRRKLSSTRVKSSKYFTILKHIKDGVKKLLFTDMLDKLKSIKVGVFIILCHCISGPSFNILFSSTEFFRLLIFSSMGQKM